MQKSRQTLAKTLILLLLPVIGYEIHPLLFPQENDPVVTEIADTPEPVKPKEIVKKDPIKKPISQPETPQSNIPTQEMTAKDPGPTEPEEIKPKESPLDSAVLVLVGRNAAQTKELEKDTELLEHASYNGEWGKYRAMLKRSLAADLPKLRLSDGKQRYSNLWQESRYYNALLRWRVLSQFPTKVTNRTKSQVNSAAMLKWVLTNDSAMEEILLTLNESDNKSKAFQFLSNIWENKPYKLNDITWNDGELENLNTLVPKYFNLALACAVVFDKKVSHKNNYDGNVDALLRYYWYRSKNEGGLLEGKIHQTSARDLTFVVCSPISTKELEWALKKYRSARRKNLGKAFSDIKYLMERAVDGLDPYEEYTLPEILKEGGICGDQTYFCVNVARAAGIPAFGLSGITDSGGHAWAAVKLDKDEWSTNPGRIGGVSKGKGRDPQTGNSITEQEVWLWSNKKYQDRENSVKVFKTLWLADFLASINESSEQKKATYLANTIGKEFPQTWQRVYKLMENDEALLEQPSSVATVSIWKKFATQIKREFKENPRMSSLATVIEDKHIFPYIDLADIRRELARMRRRSFANSKEQADLVTSSLERETAIILDKGGDKALKEIHQLYSKSLREYGGSISGFKSMIHTYFNAVKSDDAMAKKAVRTIELAFNRVVEKAGADWFRKKTEVEVYGNIAKMYRAIGDDKKADSMERTMKRDMERAKRKAL